MPKLSAEMNGRNIHRTSTAVLSLSMLAIGVALVVEALAGGGVAVVRLVLGILFAAAGCGRLYVQARGRRAA
jgi:hypothetical protein